MTSEPQDVTLLLRQWSEGNEQAGDQLFTLLMPDLRRLATRCLNRERSGHTIQRSDLINECFIKLLNTRKVDWRNRGHFFALVSRKMRHILIDYARKRGKHQRVPLDGLPEGVLAKKNWIEISVMIDKLLDELEENDPTKCSVLVFRAYLGLSIKETAEKLGLTEAVVEHEYHRARRWLFERLSEE
ncbi:MAG TPA: ECF-type sigma factor [Candidatus Angelobacter sp.]